MPEVRGPATQYPALPAGWGQASYSTITYRPGKGEQEEVAHGVRRKRGRSGGRRQLKEESAQKKTARPPFLLTHRLRPSALTHETPLSFHSRIPSNMTADTAAPLSELTQAAVRKQVWRGGMGRGVEKGTRFPF